MSSMRETITLNTQEQRRVMVSSRILARHLSAAEAASELSLSPRQVQRILAAYRKEGGPPLATGTEIASPSIPWDKKCESLVIALATGPDAGCDQQHLRDLLAEREGIVLWRTSIHRILAAAQLLPDPQRRHPVHRRRRRG
jgi:transposase